MRLNDISGAYDGAASCAMTREAGTKVDTPTTIVPTIRIKSGDVFTF